MFVVKHTVVSTAGLFGGVFGFVAAESDAFALVAAFGCMLACACVADFLTSQLEDDEDDREDN